MKEIELDDPVLECRVPPVRPLTNDTGAVVEFSTFDDAGKPLFLTTDGLPSSASGSLSGLRWLAPRCAWLPETGMFHCPGSTYSPDLGMTTARDKDKPFLMVVEDYGMVTRFGKSHELKGHVTLIK